VTALSANDSTGISDLGDFTAANLTPVLLYHVAAEQLSAADVLGDADGKLEMLGGVADIDGSAVTIDGANITTTDIITSNGVIHVIDSVLLPSITDVVTTDAELTSLAAAVGVSDGDGSGLVATLDGPGPFTLFAPTDAAFGAVIDDNPVADLGELVTALGGPSGLTDLLLYHAVGSPIYAADAVEAAQATEPANQVGTLLDANETITVTLAGGSVKLNDGLDAAAGFASLNSATVEVTDVFTANGVIHKIDAVIAPVAP